MTLIAWLAWCLLLVVCWPLALLALVLWLVVWPLVWPLVWLLSLPFRFIGVTFAAAFALLQAVLFLPARLLGGGRTRP